MTRGTDPRNIGHSQLRHPNRSFPSSLSASKSSQDTYSSDLSPEEILSQPSSSLATEAQKPETAAAEDDEFFFTKKTIQHHKSKPTLNPAELSKWEDEEMLESIRSLFITGVDAPDGDGNDEAGGDGEEGEGDDDEGGGGFHALSSRDTFEGLMVSAPPKRKQNKFQKRAVVLEPEEKRAVALLQQICALRKDQVKRRKEKKEAGKEEEEERGRRRLMRNVGMGGKRDKREAEAMEGGRRKKRKTG
ncbi:hypothetical protein F5050DRAFT_1807886 [Lentinula boryana]|uniref:Uncharacterized protein n=1 Tax=Lentinula boryana TaxID=40481 RepID=A0ABQ8QCJ1_9AGAR|nr:hypothetical protein F5050DRAFT_1807886 [Lentinula boryana]